MYLFAFCGPIACGSVNNTMATKGVTRANCIQAYGSAAKLTTGTLPTTSDASAGVQLSFTGGPRCAGLAGQQSSVVYNVRCGDAGADTPYSGASVSVSSDGCTATFELTAPAGCPLPHPAPDARISGGWVFLILLFSFTVTYCGVGMLFKAAYRRATGMEIVPNVDFWRATLRNIQLGAAVVWSKVTCSTHPLDESMYQGLDDDLALGGDYAQAPSTSAGAGPGTV